MKSMVWVATAFLLLGCVAVRASTWQVSYEGNVLPENRSGWQRAYNGSGDVRYIETDPNDPNNHFLVINSLASTQIFDYAYYPRQMDPQGPNERFWAEWKLLISQNYDEIDQGIGFGSDNGHQVGFDYGYDYIYNGFDYWSYPIEPAVFHTYRLESATMDYYTLWIDGHIVREAQWFDGVLHSTAGFGDETQGGGRSVGKWDFFRFGVYEVPEPPSFALIMTWCVGGAWRRR